MFKWFRRLLKKEAVVEPKTQNLGGLYTARLADLTDIKRKMQALEKDITDLEGKIPVLPDQSDYASKKLPNTFESMNTFDNGITINRGGTATYPISMPNHLTTKKYVDDKITEKIGEIPAPDLSNYVTLDTSQTITGAKIFDHRTTAVKNLVASQAVNAQMGEFVAATVSGPITQNDQVVNKAYVDTQLGKIPSAIALAPKMVTENTTKRFYKIYRDDVNSTLWHYWISNDSRNSVSVTTPWNSTLCMFTIIIHRATWDADNSVYTVGKFTFIQTGRTTSNGSFNVNFWGVSFTTTKRLSDNDQTIDLTFSIICEPMQN